MAPHAVLHTWWTDKVIYNNNNNFLTFFVVYQVISSDRKIEPSYIARMKTAGSFICAEYPDFHIPVFNIAFDRFEQLRAKQGKFPRQF